MTTQKVFRRWWGLAGGLTLLFITLCVDSPSATSVTVTPNRELPVLLRLVLMILGGAISFGLAAFVSLRQVQCGEGRKRSSILLWSVAAALSVFANLYLAKNLPLSEHVYTVRTEVVSEGYWHLNRSHRNPYLIHLWVTMPFAGLIGGLGHSLCAATRLRRFLSPVVWAIGITFGAIATWYAAYLLGGLGADLLEGAKLSGALGHVLGKILAGVVGGFIAAGFATFFAPLDYGLMTKSVEA